MKWDIAVGYFAIAFTIFGGLFNIGSAIFNMTVGGHIIWLAAFNGIAAVICFSCSVWINHSVGKLKKAEIIREELMNQVKGGGDN